MLAGDVDGTFEDHRRAVVEWVCEGGLGMNPLEAVLPQRQRGQVGGTGGQRMHRRADVMDVAGQGQLGGACPAADHVGRLEEEHGTPSLRQADRGGESVRARPDHDDVVAVSHRRDAEGRKPRAGR